MILSDFLSRQIEDDSNLHEIILISFNIWETLQESYCNMVTDTCKVQMRAQAKAKTNTPTVVNVQPVAQKATPETVEMPNETEKKRDIKTSPSRIIQQPLRDIVLPPGSVLPPVVVPPSVRLPPKPPNVDKTTASPDLEPDPNMDIEENSPHWEGFITKTYVAPDKSYLEQPPELIKLVNTLKVVQKYLPWQADIDRILNMIKRKVLKDTHLPLTIKEIQAGYLTSSFFRDLYKYLAQNIMPHKRHTRHKVEALAESFILLGSLLFKLVMIPDKEKALLAIPENCADQIIELYHFSLFAGHQGVIKTYLTISDKFFIPHLMHYLRLYLSACYICQLFRNDKPPSRQLETRINLSYRPMSRLSMDLKVMPKLQKGHWYILCVIDEMTNYLITALIENIISKFGTPDYMMMDQDSAFMSSLMSYLFKKLGITIKTVGPYNHRSLQAEHGIKSLSSILSKCLTDQGQMWHKFLSLAMFVYNIFHSSNLGNHYPYKIMFRRKPKLLINKETNPDIKVSGMFKDYHTLLTKRLDYLQKMLQNFKMKWLALINKDREYFQYNSGDLVYIISPLTSQLRTSSRKFGVNYVGPVVVYKIVDPHNYLLMTIEGQLMRGLFEHERLKAVILHMDKGNVRTLSELKLWTWK